LTLDKVFKYIKIFMKYWTKMSAIAKAARPPVFTLSVLGSKAGVFG
jgi:hypothetical protein